MKLEQMSSAELISLVRRQEQELAAVRASQQGGGELPQDERYASCIATIRDLDRISMKFAADLVALHSVEGSCRSDLDYLRRDDVLKLVTAWRTAWDQNSAQRMPIDRAALAQRAASVPAQAVQQPVTITAKQILNAIYDAMEEEKEEISSSGWEAIVRRVEALFDVPAASVQPTVTAEQWQLQVDALQRLIELKDKRIARLQAKQPDIGRDAALEMKNAIIDVIRYGHLHDEAPTAKLARQLLGAIERDPRVTAALAAHPANVAQPVSDAKPVAEVRLCREDNFYYSVVTDQSAVRPGDLLILAAAKKGT